MAHRPGQSITYRSEGDAGEQQAAGSSCNDRHLKADLPTPTKEAAPDSERSDDEPAHPDTGRKTKYEDRLTRLGYVERLRERLPDIGGKRYYYIELASRPTHHSYTSASNRTGGSLRNGDFGDSGSLTPDSHLTPHYHLSPKNGHSDAINTLAFNPSTEVLVATASADKAIGIWDLRNVKEKSGKSTLSPSRRFTHHSNIVNDVQYHPISRHFIGSVSDDLTLQTLDARQSSTASADKTVGIWDLRNVKEKVHTLVLKVTKMPSRHLRGIPKRRASLGALVMTGEPSSGTSVEKNSSRMTKKMAPLKYFSWNPKAGILGSASYDRRIIFWDLSRVGEEQQRDEDELEMAKGG
ncbi:WD40-repeat-containing domain protein [Xylaria flabelliformis]|nr:WD40-repeat-containing domain protein [Xylaria flabelliformis]